MKKLRPVLLLEINEVPWRLLDRFLDDERLPALRTFFKGARTLTTKSLDQGELSPWVTWPSFHRGLPNTGHKVQFLGQDPATYEGTPIWDEYRKLGLPIGIMGSLQSWPPKDPGEGGFFVPDTFAQTAACIPEWVEPFQAFNLMQTGSNARVVNEGSLYSADSLKLVLKLARSLPRLGIRPATLAAVLRQLVTERFDKRYLARRPIFQAVLAWDIFRNLYDPKSPPAFSTFFTNHVAGIMHRYWDHVFPEDFQKNPDGQAHLETMLFALEVTDRILHDAMEYTAQNPELVVIFAASMGQGPKTWKRYDGYVITIPHSARLMEACGLGASDCEPLLAMAPQICVQITDPVKRKNTRERLEQARTESGKTFMSVEEIGDRLSISLVTPSRADVEAGSFEISGARGPRKLTWQDAGMQANSVESGTGYHIPEGAMAVYGQGIAADPSRREITAPEAKDFILELAGAR